VFFFHFASTSPGQNVFLDNVSCCCWWFCILLLCTLCARYYVYSFFCYFYWS